MILSITVYTVSQVASSLLLAPQVFVGRLTALEKDNHDEEGSSVYLTLFFDQLVLQSAHFFNFGAFVLHLHTITLLFIKL